MRYSIRRELDCSAVFVDRDYADHVCRLKRCGGVLEAIFDLAIWTGDLETRELRLGSD
ncbi:MAG: hypothetical protein ACR2G6_12550 [Gemmatimonadaceae bacterium]